MPRWPQAREEGIGEAQALRTIRWENGAEACSSLGLVEGLDA